MNNIEYYICENDKIMSGLIDKHGAGDNIKNFVKDGIVNPNVWFNLPPEKERILFLLKESYEGDENIKRVSDLTKWICRRKCTEICDDKKFDCQNCGAKKITYSTMAEWIYGISNISENAEKEYDNNLKTYTWGMRDTLLQSVAVINLKKADGKNGSNNDDLYHATVEDKKELIDQIELINPTLIICGSTYGMLRCLYTDMEEPKNENDNTVNINNAAFVYKGRKIVATYHPSYSFDSDNNHIFIETPIGKWKIKTDAFPIKVDHINLSGKFPEEKEYHDQHCRFLSFADVFSYIKKHDEVLSKRIQGCKAQIMCFDTEEI